MNLIVLFLLFFAPVLQEGRVRPLVQEETLLQEKTVPLKLNPTLWVGLDTLEQSEKNFTLFTDADFADIRSAYLKKDTKQLSKMLKKGYQTLKNRSFTLSNQETFIFPSLFQLHLESFYIQFPWLITLLILSFLSFFLKKLSIVSFSLHTLLLCIRALILERPPVTSMYETLLFVPWVALLFCLILFYIYRQPLLLKGGAFIQATLLTILLCTDQTSHLDTIQPVLNSNFWLSIHVLLVVGSYGIFTISSLLGHTLLLYRTELLEKILINTLYLGVIALMAGTLLGGVWAAQSWGRFWDWDPKESWAFISLSFYLVAIHLYRFQKIGTQGLAIGAIVGFLSISFCWYGVNYIIGTGMHSYGFGTGGIIYYFSFIAIESSFLLFALTTIEKNKIVRRKLRKGYF